MLFTTAILLFSFGMLIQYRLYSDPEYNARNKAAAREEKMAGAAHALHHGKLRSSQKTDDGFAANTGTANRHRAAADVKLRTIRFWNALTSSYTWIPVFSFFAFAHRLFASACVMAFCSGSSETVSSSSC